MYTTLALSLQKLSLTKYSKFNPKGSALDRRRRSELSRSHWRRHVGLTTCRSISSMENLLIVQKCYAQLVACTEMKNHKETDIKDPERSTIRVGTRKNSATHCR